jgi:hypothetical protein
MLRIEERSQESPMELPQGKRGGGRKRRAESPLGALVTSVTSARLSHTLCFGVTESTW